MNSYGNTEKNVIFQDELIVIGSNGDLKVKFKNGCNTYVGITNRYKKINGPLGHPCVRHWHASVFIPGASSEAPGLDNTGYELETMTIRLPRNENYYNSLPGETIFSSTRPRLVGGND
ncbi:hypothetical protein TNCV_1589831 [Trichonephila clavipes]|uniref:Uncharacterized protein n=1 Tax=Trichonephila clavipes TaxID=2585209 RepID=A0A8X6RRF0_TRICX|nr:hypothetical protein TNCV_1589831 [Trichonephila clavipes]